MNSLAIMSNFIKVMKIVSQTYLEIDNPSKYVAISFFDHIFPIFAFINKINNINKTDDSKYWNDRKFLVIAKAFIHFSGSKVENIINNKNLKNTKNNIEDKLNRLIALNNIDSYKSNNDIINNNNNIFKYIDNKNISDNYKFDLKCIIAFNNTSTKIEELENLDNALNINNIEDNNYEIINEVAETYNEISKKDNSPDTINNNRDKRKVIWLLHTEDKNLKDELIKMGEKEELLKELIITQNETFKEFWIYINFKARTDLFKTKYVNNIFINSLMKINEQKTFIKNKGKKIYENKFA